MFSLSHPEMNCNDSSCHVIDHRTYGRMNLLVELTLLTSTPPMFTILREFREILRNLVIVLLLYIILLFE